MEREIKAAFDAVHAEESLKENTRAFLRAQTAPRAHRPARWMRPALGAACCLVLLGGAGGVWAYATPVAEISVDVNPSLELTLNRFDRVIGVQSYNEDGEWVLDGLQLQNKTYTEAVTALLDSTALQSYLANGAQLSFGVAAATESAQSDLLAGLQTCAGQHSCYAAGTESAEAAHALGMSVGKYLVYQALLPYRPDLTPEQAQQTSMHELQRELAACGGTAEGGHGAHMGGGHHGQGGC